MTLSNAFRRFSQLRPKMTADSTLQTIRRQMAPLGGGRVELERVHDVATVRLVNPAAKNGISGRMMSQMWEVLEELRLWPQGRALVVSGADRFFCSGGDLAFVRQIADSENGRKMSLLMQHNLLALQSLPLVSVAAIDGMAIGGGAEIATACDFRLMSPEARIGFVHIRLGICSAWGGGARLSRLIGPQKAFQLMLSGRKVKADEALRLGLVDDVIAGADVEMEARDWLLRLLEGKARESVRAVKQVVNGARFLSLEDALKEEVEASASVWGGRANREALAAGVKHRN